MATSQKILRKKVPSQIFDRILNTPLLLSIDISRGGGGGGGGESCVRTHGLLRRSFYKNDDRQDFKTQAVLM